jgi:glycolate oxidase
MINDAAYTALEDCVGRENASREPAVLDTYAWQPFVNEDPSKWVSRPVAVVLPASTEEVQAVVKACNRYGLKFKAFSTGWGAWAGPSEDNVVQVDLRRMDRILEIDEKNMYAVIEPNVCNAQLQAEAMKRGLNCHIHGSGPNCSPLASATAAFGVGNDSIYMAYSARNVLSVEWVLPDGELLKLGSLGSDLGWFVGDGPGPSLRGILRGAAGALSGLGIITKCALKLYDWSGPPVIETTGVLLTAQSKIPENTRLFSCFFPTGEEFSNAVYKISDAEIGYNALRLNPGGIPGLEAHKDNPYHYLILLHGNSTGDMNYQVKALNTIVDQCRGTLVDFADLPMAQATLYMNVFRSTLWALAFKRGGSFHTMIGRNESIDLQTDFAEMLADIKKPYMENGLILDPVADNPYYVSYENGTWAHVEVIFQYDPRNRAQIENMKNMSLMNLIVALEKCSDPMFSYEPPFKKIMSPICGDFASWQNMISGQFDPNESADTGRYLKEEDFDMSDLPGEKVARLRELLEQYKWKDGHPPE